MRPAQATRLSAVQQRPHTRAIGAGAGYIFRLARTRRTAAATVAWLNPTRSAISRVERCGEAATIASSS